MSRHRPTRWPACPAHWDETTVGFLTELALASLALGAAAGALVLAYWLA